MPSARDSGRGSGPDARGRSGADARGPSGPAGPGARGPRNVRSEGDGPARGAVIDYEAVRRARNRRWDRFFQVMTGSFFLLLAMFVVLFFSFFVRIVQDVF